MAKCDLCELKEYTPWYASFTQPFRFTILDCDSCDTPMAVLGDHRAEPTAEERAFIIDGIMRQIPDHCHMHARPKRWRG